MKTQQQWVTRQTLLQRVVQQDNESAWEDFVRYYGDFIEMLITKMHFQGDGREDIKQEILLKLWNSMASFDPEKGAFRTWMSALVRHAILNYYRAAERRNERLRVVAKQKKMAEFINSTSSPDFDRMIEEEWRSYIIELALKRLTNQVSKNALDVFALTLRGVAIDDICQQLELKRDTVYTLRNRVKIRFQKEVRHLITELELKPTA